MNVLDERALSRIEKTHEKGVTSAEILELLSAHGMPFSEATLRKYVQLGLLPRSVRVGRKGKHKGSQGLYPVGVVRQIVRIRSMMANDYTIERIQREFLFVRSDIETLERTLTTIFSTLDRVVCERAPATRQRLMNEVAEAKEVGGRLVETLSAIERRLTSSTEVDHVAAS